MTWARLRGLTSGVSGERSEVRCTPGLATTWAAAGAPDVEAEIAGVVFECESALIVGVRAGGIGGRADESGLVAEGEAGRARAPDLGVAVADGVLASALLVLLGRDAREAKKGAGDANEALTGGEVESEDVRDGRAGLGLKREAAETTWGDVVRTERLERRLGLGSDEGTDGEERDGEKEGCASEHSWWWLTGASAASEAKSAASRVRHFRG